MCVMLIDDSETDLLYTRIVLERSGLGCEIVTFESARDALAHLQAAVDDDGIELILLDINMPGMDGFEFLDAYEARMQARNRAQTQARQAPVAMLTSSPDPADRVRAQRHACVRGYRTKPLDVPGATALCAQALA